MLSIMLTSATTTLGLLDLHDDVLDLIVGHLPPTTLVQVACTCKAAAVISLPKLYFDLIVPSIAALPLIYSTLQSRPELAQHVRSVTASRYFVLSYDFQEHEPTIQECRMCPESPIVSIHEAIKRIGLETLNSKLPMPWLIRIAKLCPNFKFVDFTEVADFGVGANSLLLGLVGLVHILRSRLGFFSFPGHPFSCIFVKDRAQKLDVAFVDSIDFSRKQIAITDGPCTSTALGSKYTLVPFRDLVPLEEQAQWSIGDVTLRNHVGKANPSLLGEGTSWTVSSWLESKDDMWLKGGMVAGQDRLFDFYQLSDSGSGLIKGSVTLAMFTLRFLNDLTSPIHLDLGRQFQDLIMDSPDPAAIVDFTQSSRDLITLQSMSIYETLINRPLPSISSLHLSKAAFLDKSTVARLMSLLAAGLPNLSQLELFDSVCPPDYILYHADALIRRSASQGSPLHSLTAGSYIAHPTSVQRGCPYKHTSSPKDWPLAHQPVSLLGPSSGCQLTILKLFVRGAGVDHLSPENAATVAIHPDILRNLQSLRLESVKLFLSPLALAQPNSPSFIPLSHIESPARILCPVNHALSLPNLESLTMSSNAFNLPMMRGRSASRVLDAVPRAPSLKHISMFVDCVEGQRKMYTTDIVTPFLRRFPRLEYAQFDFLTVTKSEDQVAKEVRSEFFAPYPRELGPCPRLRCVQVNDGEPIEYYQWLLASEKRVGSSLESVEMSRLAVE